MVAVSACSTQERVALHNADIRTNDIVLLLVSVISYFNLFIVSPFSGSLLLFQFDT